MWAAHVEATGGAPAGHAVEDGSRGKKRPREDEDVGRRRGGGAAAAEPSGGVGGGVAAAEGAACVGAGGGAGWERMVDGLLEDLRRARAAAAAGAAGGTNYSWGGLCSAIYRYEAGAALGRRWRVASRPTAPPACARVREARRRASRAAAPTCHRLQRHLDVGGRFRVPSACRGTPGRA